MTRWADRCVVSRAAKSWAQSGYQESYGDFVLNYKGYGKGFQPREYEEMSPAQRRQIGEAEALEALTLTLTLILTLTLTLTRRTSRLWSTASTTPPTRAGR